MKSLKPNRTIKISAMFVGTIPYRKPRHYLAPGFSVGSPTDWPRAQYAMVYAPIRSRVAP